MDEIIRGPPVSRELLKNSFVHQVALGALHSFFDLLKLSTSGEFIPIVVDEFERSYRVLDNFDNHLYLKVLATNEKSGFRGLNATDIEFDDAMFATLVSCAPKGCANGKIFLIAIRHAAWAWIRHWKKPNRRRTVELFERLIEKARLQASNGDSSSSQYAAAAFAARVQWKDLLAATPESVCACCKQFATRQCMGAGCMALYCSTKCQKKDWRCHKSDCNARAKDHGVATF